MGNDFFDTREQLKRAIEKLGKVTNERDELEDERKKLMETVINFEQKLGDVAREIELKEVKIDSLQAII